MIGTIKIPQDSSTTGEQCAKESRKINCDQEAWVIARLNTMLNMATALRDNKNVAAEDGMLKCAVDGLINGTAIEIIQTVGLEPEYTNIKQINW